MTPKSKKSHKLLAPMVLDPYKSKYTLLSRENQKLK